jgi:excisionase family DNA binding protein
VTICDHAGAVAFAVTGPMVCRSCGACDQVWWEKDGSRVVLSDALVELRERFSRIEREARAARVIVSPVPDKAWLTSGEVARVCGVHIRTIPVWVKQGVLHAYRTPGKPRAHYRFSRGEVIEYLEARA